MTAGQSECMGGVSAAPRGSKPKTISRPDHHQRYAGKEPADAQPEKLHRSREAVLLVTISEA